MHRLWEPVALTVKSMARPRRIAGFFAMSLLLIMTIAVIVFWCRSAHSMDEVILTTKGRRLIDISSFRGKVDLVTINDWPNDEKIHFLSASPSSGAENPAIYPPPPFPIPDWHGSGISFWSWGGAMIQRSTCTVDLNPDGTAHWAVQGSIDRDYWTSGRRESGDMPMLSAEVPYWMLLSPLAAPVVLGFLVLGLPVVKRWRRMRNGLCPACGYDLRASKDRCPECGTPSQSTAVPEKIGGSSN